LEFDIDVTTLASAPPDDGGPALFGDERWSVRYRLPSSADLDVVASLADVQAARAALLGRCVLEVAATDGASRATVGDLPPALRDALEEEMGRRDPHGATTVAATCAGCGHAWTTLFDGAGYLWRELEDEADRRLRVVDTLARAYGWSEGEILGLSTQRRNAYVDLAGGR